MGWPIDFESSFRLLDKHLLQSWLGLRASESSNPGLTPLLTGSSLYNLGQRTHLAQSQWLLWKMGIIIAQTPAWV